MGNKGLHLSANLSEAQLNEMGISVRANVERIVKEHLPAPWNELFADKVEQEIMSELNKRDGLYHATNNIAPMYERVFYALPYTELAAKVSHMIADGVSKFLGDKYGLKDK